MCNNEPTSTGCGCDAGYNRREFMTLAGLATGAAMASMPFMTRVAEGSSVRGEKRPARVRVAFLYPASSAFADAPDGWWSWPGNEFDTEGRQRAYMESLENKARPLGVQLQMDSGSIQNEAQAQSLITALGDERPDGLVLIMFYNRSLSLADTLLEAAKDMGIPVVFYIGLGVKHGSIAAYRREGVYFIQAYEDLEAIANGLRMIAAKVRLEQSLILSVTEADARGEGVEEFFGIRVRVIPFDEYARLFKEAQISASDRSWMETIVAEAQEVRGISAESAENALRAHLALRELIAAENADGVTMNCLQTGMLKPCISFSELNSELIPAACENDLAAAYTQMLGQLLTGKPGFQHNPAFDTERNQYYASHCTCPIRLQGPEGPKTPYLLRRFAHTNEGSCAIQVFWEEGEPLTMVRYHYGEAPKLDVYAGRVAASYPMPPVGGCTTNVAVELTDRKDACMVQGHHNLLFHGDYARRFRLFANLYGLPLADTGFDGHWAI